MRVLIVPEVYRPGDATACGTLNDATTWVDQWLDRDDRLHVYWLLPPRETAGYDAAYVRADRERVTLIEADPPMADADRRDLFTEDGYAAAELRALREAVHDPGAYLDVVVDQRRTGRETLYKWLLEPTDQWAARVSPFDVVANVHDLQVPEKYRWCSHRNRYQSVMEACTAAFADGVWFTAGVDARRFREYAEEFLDSGVVKSVVEEAIVTGSPVEFDCFETEFAAEPTHFHVAGSLWEKKNADRVLAVGECLADRFGIRTVMTSPEAIPAEFSDRPWVDAHPNASRETYERALERGDLAVCASEYETMARTPFEQAASGQVLVLRDRPWVYDCVPEDYGLVAPLDGLVDRVVRAVGSWDESVAETRRMVEHTRSARSPGAVGERTYRALLDRVRSKTKRYPAGGVVARTVDGIDGPVTLPAFVRATAEHTDDGRPLTARDDVASVDVIHRLRRNGYVDRGDPGTPVFEAGELPTPR